MTSLRTPSTIPTLLEVDLPYKQLSLIAGADRRARDPVYGVHRWWARRPPGVIRALLLAAALPGDTTRSDFWRLFRSAGHPLHKLTVHDLFVGGGTTVVEASRLGATPSGTDVDPLAVAIVRHELARPDSRIVSAAGKELLEFLERSVGHLFRPSAAKWIPLHFFYLHQVECPHCTRASTLFRNLVIARDASKNGGVVRDSALTAFCPECFALHELPSVDRKRLRCCGTHNLDKGNFEGQRFRCEHCGHRSTHAQLKTGIAPRRLLAVEETRQEESRRFRQPLPSDLEALRQAEQYLRAHRTDMWLPGSAFRKDRRDSRPLSLGITTPLELFTDRQLALFGLAFRWVRDCDQPADIKAALSLAVSGALTTNNKLCSYATDYGRLAPLFSVRSYSLPALAVELNPFHPSGGRGTLYRAIQRVSRSTTPQVRRHVWETKRQRPEAVTFNFRRNGVGADVRCVSAETHAASTNDIDICLFDPPYFDYIAYSELSEFYRHWLNRTRLGGRPLLPEGRDPVTSYGEMLARCIVSALKRLKKDRPLAFTFHSADQRAWDAIGIALDRADVLITALWPVRNDVHMGHHARDANCEWDIVVVCRRRQECSHRRLPYSFEKWRRAVSPMPIHGGDANGMRLALSMASERFGQPRKGQSR